MIIDEGSYVIVASERCVNKLALPTIFHPRLYRLQWLSEKGEFLVGKEAQVTFTLSGLYVKPLSPREVHENQKKMKVKRKSKRKIERKIRKKESKSDYEKIKKKERKKKSERKARGERKIIKNSEIKERVKDPSLSSKIKKKIGKKKGATTSRSQRGEKGPLGQEGTFICFYY
ncbi:hypothetical protein CR513_14709, partial [Mucuna pruriens]